MGLPQADGSYSLPGSAQCILEHSLADLGEMYHRPALPPPTAWHGLHHRFAVGAEHGLIGRCQLDDHAFGGDMKYRKYPLADAEIRPLEMAFLRGAW